MCNEEIRNDGMNATVTMLTTQHKNDSAETFTSSDKVSGEEKAFMVTHVLYYDTQKAFMVTQVLLKKVPRAGVKFC